MSGIPSYFHSNAQVDTDTEPDGREPGTVPVAIVDTSRTKAKGDPDAPDAVWVCMIGGSTEDVSGPESRQAAIHYVASNYGTAAPSIDKTFGPMGDDGSIQVPRGIGNLSSAPMSAADYLRLAATQNVTQKATGHKQYCYFIRVRRNIGL